MDQREGQRPDSRVAADAPDRKAERAEARRARALRGGAIAAVSTSSSSAGSRCWCSPVPAGRWSATRSSTRTSSADTFPDILEGLLARHPRLRDRRGGGADHRPRGRAAADVSARRRCSRCGCWRVVYTDVFRGIPVILLVYLIGFGVPALALGESEDGSRPLDWLPTEPVVLGGFALALCYGAYVAEVYRAGINSVHPGQRDAALAVGLTEGQALRHVIVPAGRSPRRPAAPQRLHRPAEGRGADRDHRRHRRGVSRRRRSRRRRTSTTRRSSRPRCSTCASRSRWPGSWTAGSGSEAAR